MSRKNTGTLAKVPRLYQPSRVPDPENEGEYLTVMEAIVTSLEANPRRATAAWLAGITPSTLSEWIDRGETILKLQEKQANVRENLEAPFPNLADIPGEDRPYVQLVLNIGFALASRQQTLVGHINRAARKEWKAAQAALQADEQGSWLKPTTRLELTGPDGGGAAQVRQLDRAGYTRLTGELAERRAAALPVAEVAEA